VAEPWVINASPIIVLAKVGLMEKVPSLADPLVVPEAVAQEIRSCAIEDAAVRWLKGAGQSFIRPTEPAPLQLAGSGIGHGEKSVIAWALVHLGFIAVLDDSAARSQARRLGLPVLGTVGVVIRLKQAGLIDKVKPRLLQIRQAGGHIGEGLLREALHCAGEES
jgi:predicted nucleic acid-binding protein